MSRSSLDEHISGCVQCRKGPVLCTRGRAIAAVAVRRVDAQREQIAVPSELDDDLSWLR